MNGSDRPVDWATALVDVINAPGDEGELKKKRDEMEKAMVPDDEEQQEDSVTKTP